MLYCAVDLLRDLRQVVLHNGRSLCVDNVESVSLLHVMKTL